MEFVFGYCCADAHADSDGPGANAELPGLLGTGRRIVKPETAAFRVSFTQAAAAAASAALVSQRFGSLCPMLLGAMESQKMLLGLP